MEKGMCFFAQCMFQCWVTVLDMLLLCLSW